MSRDPFDEPTLPGPGQRYAPGMKVFRGRFVLERRIGRGGMGEVWMATDTELGGSRALKFLPPEVASDPKALAQLRREAARGRLLAHPRIVRVDDFYTDPDAGMGAVAMEYVEGRTLNEIQAEIERGFFDAGEIKTWLRDACEALDYAHEEAGVVHRDLKPSNIIIETTTGNAKLLDFGIARRIAETHTQITGNDNSGTLAYSSPQQLGGERGTPADDMYALGATIYELLTGAPPFFRGDLRMQIGVKVPPPMAERREELQSEGLVLEGGAAIAAHWEAAVAACLSKEAEHRPQRTRDLVAALSQKGTSVHEKAAPANMPEAEPPPAATPPPLPPATSIDMMQALPEPGNIFAPEPSQAVDPSEFETWYQSICRTDRAYRFMERADLLRQFQEHLGQPPTSSSEEETPTLGAPILEEPAFEKWRQERIKEDPAYRYYSKKELRETFQRDDE